MQYVCNPCSFGSNFVAEMWNHVLDSQPESKADFNGSSKPVILFNLAAEQNVDIMEDFSTLNKDMKECFKQFAH